MRGGGRGQVPQSEGTLARAQEPLISAGAGLSLYPWRTPQRTLHLPRVFSTLCPMLAPPSTAGLERNREWFWRLAQGELLMARGPII